MALTVIAQNIYEHQVWFLNWNCLILCEQYFFCKYTMQAVREGRIVMGGHYTLRAYKCFYLKRRTINVPSVYLHEMKEKGLKLQKKNTFKSIGICVNDYTTSRWENGKINGEFSSIYLFHQSISFKYKTVMPVMLALWNSMKTVIWYLIFMKIIKTMSAS